MSPNLKILVRKILSTSQYYEKMYPYVSHTIDDDVDYFYKNICKITPLIKKLSVENQAAMIVTCFSQGLKNFYNVKY